MTMAERLTLDGCAPTPLASYLKALGVLRLLSSGASNVTGEPADAGARGWWEGERFHLRTTLGREGVTDFFLHQYAPSPVIAPWNSGSGFYAKDNKDGLAPLSAEVVAPRFMPFSAAIRVAADTLADLELVRRPTGQQKADLVALLRSRLAESALPWVDAALVLSGDRLSFPQLLGTGGNDGRLDFTNNLMRRLVSARTPRGIFDASSGKPSGDAPAKLEHALWGTPVHDLTSVAVGQFAPGGAGGPNATTGYEGDAAANPWDYVLMLEGAATFASTTTRRYQTNAVARASFPFTVGVSGAGWGGVEAADESDARAEFWAPLWTRPTRFREIRALFGEGRAVTNGRTARDGLEFARSLASLGVSRGFSEFQRYGFFKRAGKNHYAAALGRRAAAPSPSTELLADLDRGGWLMRVRRVARDDNQPAAIRRGLKALEDSLFDLLGPRPSRESVAVTLAAVGRIASWLSNSPSAREKIPPPPLLSRAWLRQADDGTPEFRVAAALAGLGIPSASPTRGSSDKEEAQSAGALAPPMAAHFAPLTWGARDGFEARTFFQQRGRLRKRRQWAEGGPPTVVWGHGGLAPNMIAVLERRLVEAPIRRLTDKPLTGAGFARLSDVSAFLREDFDDSRCSDLLAGMVWAEPTWFPKATRQADENAEPGGLPFAYAALKPLFSTDAALASAGAIPSGVTLPIPPGLVSRLRAAGDARDGASIAHAVATAFVRARSSGLPSPYDPFQSGGRRAAEPAGRMGVGIRADRLAAALLIPVSAWGLASLLRRVYPEPDTEPTSPSEDSPNAS